MTKLFLSYFQLMCRGWILFFCTPLPAWSWGFFIYKQINRYAIASLPPGMFQWYKSHLPYLTEHAVQADKRRYSVKEEASKHFIDLEYYQSALSSKKNLSFSQAIEKYGLHQVEAHGQLPWAILKTHKGLTQAFIDKNLRNILKYSADLGHYVADAHVPLHTTQNYNGQMSDQEGIHALWESRLPLLFFDRYNLWVGQAHYIAKPLEHVWTILLQSHALVPTLLALEKEIADRYPAWLHYSFEQDGCLLKKQYAVEFATSYHQALKGQIERCVRQSIIEVANFWLTAWKNAGSPSLAELR